MIIPGVVASGRYEAAAGVTALDLGANAFSFTGATVKRVVPAGVKSMRLKLWGGGGGGGQFGKEGGPGGFVFTTVEVNPGDLLLIQVGGGGGNSTGSTPQNGGAGGWPDGGDGGYTTTLLFALGGGGGSSRVYVNGVLKAVAAGGGGGGGNSGGSSLNAGGGFHGLSKTINTQNPSGGHTTEGGTDIEATVTANPFSPGTFLKGGRGWFSGGRFTSQAAAAAGGGGGGGYYGGGAGGQGIGGSGGSSFYSLAQALERLNTTSLGSTAPSNGARAPAPATGDAAYPGSNVATGGSATFARAAVSTPGGNGFIQVFTYADLPQPVRVSQQDVQIVSQPLGAVRVSQQAVEVAYKLGIEPVRVTQQTIEVPHISAPAPVRVTQQTVEVIYSL